MANRMIHDPSYLSTVSDIAEYWTSATNTISIASGWYKSSSSGNEGQLNMTLDSQSGWTIGFLWKYAPTTAGSSTWQDIITLIDSAVTHVIWQFQPSTGLWRVTRNATVLLTSVTAQATGTEYYIEFQTVINDSTGVAIMKVDGATDSVINSSALDTRNAGNASANAIQFQCIRTGTGNNQFRNIYINDNAGGVDDTFWGPIAVPTLVMQSNGTTNQWTPLSSTNSSNVDDATVDQDSTYNATSTNGHIDLFNASNTGYSSGTVKGVEWAAEVRRTDASATARVAPTYRIGGSNYVGSDIAITSTYRIQTQRARVSPATSSAWTVSELDGMEIGIKRTAG